MTESRAVPSSPNVQHEEVQGTNFLRHRGTVEDIKEISAKKHWADTMPHPGTKGRDGIARHSKAQEEIFLPNGTKPSPKCIIAIFAGFSYLESLQVVSCTLATLLYLSPQQDGERLGSDVPWVGWVMPLQGYSYLPEVEKNTFICLKLESYNAMSSWEERDKAPRVTAAQTIRKPSVGWNSLEGQWLNPE